ncbi:interferon alpha-inducible protein 27-like protein 1 [Rhineura floridana]|uniref:interferon alpha-inducible protein 27-like protein 1 n=1 Tax=Rhineura floridana TaxID=261503 RepID=UPI002AC815EB|nr:interferon alpha-inducible protein 27-like protein 1 [Rhineura floridana]
MPMFSLSSFCEKRLTSGSVWAAAQRFASAKMEKEKEEACSLGSSERWTRLGNMGMGAMIAATLGVGITVVAVPVVLGAVGFTSAGTAAGSYAASMMSASAVASGGAVSAGSTVAVLQSVGAAGLALSTKVGVTVATASAGAAIGAAKKLPSST